MARETVGASPVAAAERKYRCALAGIMEGRGGFQMFGSRYDFAPGDRVVVVAWSLRGARGTLLRKTRLPWNGRRAWIVELDGGKLLGGKRQPLAEAVLLPLAAFQEE